MLMTIRDESCVLSATLRPHLTMHATQQTVSGEGTTTQKPGYRATAINLSCAASVESDVGQR